MTVINKVPYIDQTTMWPTGCESVSAVMCLQSLGVQVTVDEFIEKDLPKKPMTKVEGEWYGPNPNEFFAGSPYDDQSFGCYPGVCVKAMNHCIERLGMERVGRAVDITGAGVEELFCHIDSGRSVLYWCGIDMQEPLMGPSWKLDDTGEKFTWISHEHCMLLVGYDKSKELLYFNDPWHNHGCVGIPQELALRRHEDFKGMAVTVIHGV